MERPRENGWKCRKYRQIRYAGAAALRHTIQRARCPDEAVNTAIWPATPAERRPRDTTTTMDAHGIQRPPYGPLHPRGYIFFLHDRWVQRTVTRHPDTQGGIFYTTGAHPTLTPKGYFIQHRGQLHLWVRPQADFTPQTNPEDRHTLP